MSRSLSGIAVVTALLASPFAAWVGLDRLYYLPNDEIAAAIPEYPGARLTTRSDGFLEYAVPAGTTRAGIDRFFREQMPDGWTRPDGDCAGFTRRGGLVIFNVQNRTLEVSIWRKGAGDCAEYEWAYYS